MTDEDALLAAVIDDPGEDTPRLAYADWLDENAGGIECGACMGFRHNGLGPHRKPCAHCGATGVEPDGRHARAEFVRVQCELAAAFPHVAADPAFPGAVRWRQFARYAELRRRERELWLSLYDGLVSEVNLWLRRPRATADGCAVRWHVGDGRTMGTTWTRGFVGEVTLPAAAFVGGPCGRCVGGRPGGQFWFSGRCPTCNDTGRTPGLAGELFLRHPIGWVTFTGAEPWSVLGDARWFAAAAAPGPHPQSDIPPELWTCLREYGDTDGSEGQGSMKWYPGVGPALSALSDAGRRLGRERAATLRATTRSHASQ